MISIKFIVFVTISALIVSLSIGLYGLVYNALKEEGMCTWYMKLLAGSAIAIGGLLSITLMSLIVSL